MDIRGNCRRHSLEIAQLVIRRASTCNAHAKMCTRWRDAVIGHVNVTHLAGYSIVTDPGFSNRFRLQISSQLTGYCTPFPITNFPLVTDQLSDRAIEGASERSIERPSERGSSERSSQRPSERPSERLSERSSDRPREGPTEKASDRPSY